LTTNHLVTGGRVADKFKSSQPELPSFVEIKDDVHQSGFVVDILAWDRCPVDIAARPVDLFQILKTLPNELSVEHLSLLHAKDAQQLFFGELSVSGEVHIADTILIPFLNIHIDEHAFPLP